MNDIVHCHAGWQYPEHPTELFWEGEWHEIIHVLHEWRRTDGYGYVVRAKDERIFELFYIEEPDNWEIKLYSGGQK